MTDDTRAVISGERQWSCEERDAIDFLNALPNDSVDLLFCSPPYTSARTYGRDDIARGTEEWVAWMMTVVRAAVPKVKGLIAVNCEGQTKDYKYNSSPYLLLADLHRAGFNLRRPAFFHRVGIPGSGGPDWLRADVEPIICITREGKLPWSDNTAMGTPPKYGPGGVISHRVTNGTRVNQKKVKDLVEGGMSQRGAARQVGLPLKGTTMTSDKNDTINGATYVPPDLANPGNVIEATYTASEVTALLAEATELVHCSIGGGKMGSPYAHHNEAPFPEELPNFFIRSFCPPGGVVCDPFGGSGTCVDAAVQAGRRGISCDLRASQVELCRRRMKNCTPALFS